MFFAVISNLIVPPCCCSPTVCELLECCNICECSLISCLYNVLCLTASDSSVSEYIARRCNSACVKCLCFLVNAVNLTDGLDGLCTGVTFVSMIGYLLAGSLLGFVHVSLIAAATAGACAGFLVWNFYPAKVFMGDTGSMFFGGIVTALAFVMQRPELVLFFGIVYIWDAMTVVIQRTYFKATHGKRIFRMTPIHHAFEMRGWREVKIDGFFALIAVIGVAMGIFYICVA